MLPGADVYGAKHVRVGEFDETQPDAQDLLLTRQALHAAYLGFEHPITGKKVSFQAPMWGDFQRAVDLLPKKSLKQVLGATGSILEIGSPT